jgi:lysophospholipase
MSLSQAGVAAGLDMTTEAALTKLAFLLALPDSTPRSVARSMFISLRGELTEQSQTIFRHPDGTLPDRVKNLAALGYAIAQGNLDKVLEVMRGEPNWLLNDADYSGNTPLVSSPVSFIFPRP